MLVAFKKLFFNRISVMAETPGATSSHTTRLTSLNEQEHGSSEEEEHFVHLFPFEDDHSS